MTSNRRPLNAKEASYLFEEHFTNFTLATTVYLPPPTLQRVESAIKNQQNLHPILRSRILILDGGSSFALYEIGTPPVIPLKIVKVGRTDDLNTKLQQVAQTELNLPIPVETGPLARVTLIVPEGDGSSNYVLIMCFTHAVCDGKQGFTILKDALVELVCGSNKGVELDKVVALSSFPVVLISDKLSMFTSTCQFVLEMVNLFGWLLTKKVSMLPNCSSFDVPAEKGTLLHIVNVDQQQICGVAAKAKAKGGTVTSLLVYAVARAVGRQVEDATYNLLGAISVDNRPLLDLPPKLDGAFNGILLVPFSSTTTSVYSINCQMRRLLARNMNFHTYKFLASKKVVTPPPASSRLPAVPVSFAVSNLGNYVIPEVGKEIVGPVVLSSTQHDSRGGLVEVTVVTVNGIMSVAITAEASYVSRRTLVGIGEHILADMC